MQTERIIVPEIQIGENGWIYSGPPGPLIAGAVFVGVLVIASAVLLILRLTRKRDRE